MCTYMCSCVLSECEYVTSPNTKKRDNCNTYKRMPVQPQTTDRDLETTPSKVPQKYRRRGRGGRAGGRGHQEAAGGSRRGGAGIQFLPWLGQSVDHGRNWSQGGRPEGGTARMPRAGAEGPGRAFKFFYEWANRSIMVEMGARGGAGRRDGPPTGRPRGLCLSLCIHIYIYK